MFTEIEQAAHLIALLLDPVLAELDLTHAEAHVLAQLAERRWLTATQLHHEFGHKRSTLTSVLDRLERRGLVERTPNPSDRRSIIVTLTDRGRPVAAEILGVRAEFEWRVRAQVSERDVGSLGRIVRALRGEAGR